MFLEIKYIISVTNIKRYTVLDRGKTLVTAKHGEIKPEELQEMMAGGQELNSLKDSLEDIK